MEGFSLDLNEERLVQMEGKDPVRMTELDKIEAKAKGIKFFDVYGRPFSYTPPRLHDQVTKVIQTLSTDGPIENLVKFSGFRTRRTCVQMGKQSQKWLLSKIVEITNDNASPTLRSLITVEEFTHSWGQNSIVRRVPRHFAILMPSQIARINGSSPVDDRAVIIGAHQDRHVLRLLDVCSGADDDGSGTVTILEAYRSLLAAGFIPERPVEFHWYSAEEGGLLGSQAVAKAYNAKSVGVYAMSQVRAQLFIVCNVAQTLQFDMTAWVKRGSKEEVGVIVDYVDDALTNYNKQLIDTYLSIPYAETKCGYACSDHASWSKAGYPSIFTIESAFENANHNNIHSSRDRIDISTEFSFDHMLEFSKLAVAFAMELSTI
ncbi:hypothetical protein JVU11DRAFT_6229 [Chiua virens]|nr:hypothetical protein JVU11DRAFT_6229 [Chiua virens]